MKEPDQDAPELIVEPEAKSHARWIKYFPPTYMNRKDRRFELRNPIRSRTRRKKR